MSFERTCAGCREIRGLPASQHCERFRRSEGTLSLEVEVLQWEDDFAVGQIVPRLLGEPENLYSLPQDVRQFQLMDIDGKRFGTRPTRNFNP